MKTFIINNQQGKRFSKASGDFNKIHYLSLIKSNYPNFTEILNDSNYFQKKILFDY